MKKIITVLFLITSTYSFGSDSPNFYCDIHAMGGYPMIGVGTRFQEGIHGFDLSINACPLNPTCSLNAFHTKGLYLFYPNKEGFYLGSGLGICKDPETMKRMDGSFEATIGYQSKNRFFIECGAFATFHKNECLERFICPALTIGCGF